ncbi:MAG: hypothetical protein M1829_004531 [Trizodia sp. TS-e1964]|nr:MAG: hypothetical protein M1829_004531 [Trizodia sp. TS-e1964]
MGIFHIAVHYPLNNYPNYEWEIYMSRTASLTDMRYTLRPAATLTGDPRFIADTVVELNKVGYLAVISIEFMNKRIAEVLNSIKFADYPYIGNNSQLWIKCVLAHCIKEELLDKELVIKALGKAITDWTQVCTSHKMGVKLGGDVTDRFGGSKVPDSDTEDDTEDDTETETTSSKAKDSKAERTSDKGDDASVPVKSRARCPSSDCAPMFSPHGGVFEGL